MSSTIPWIEKYRPKTVIDLILDDLSMAKINKIIADKDMQNIIITGLPGIGKTTTIKCIARGLYGKHVNDAVLELNASDDRGIKAVQDTIMTFCKKRLRLNEDLPTDSPKLYADHKIIILDEADNMTHKAQALINNLMEKYHDTTRFAFTCNDSSDIIEGIQSRCTIMKYSRVTKDKIYDRLIRICGIEKITFEEKAIMAIATNSHGDIRTAINSLQLVYNCYNSIKLSNIASICDKPQLDIVINIISALVKRDFKLASSIVMDLVAKGYSETDVILNISYIIKTEHIDIDDIIKHKILDKLAMSSYYISKGLDTQLQLIGCISSIINCLKN